VLVYLTFLKVTGSVVANANVPGQSRMTRQEESLKMLIMNRNFKSGGCPDLC
jgi:hypothetical protein